jgi:type II secretory pathway pseudopilin PulG
LAERSEKSATEKKYLLGVLPAEESARLEDQYFADDQLFEEIELEEDELIDGYIRKTLDKNDRKVFEQAMRRSKRLNERVAFARVLLTKTSKQPVPAPLPTPSWWASIKAFFSGPAVLKTALATVLVLVVVGAVFFTVERGRLLQESQQLAQQRSSLEEQRQQLRREINEAQLESQSLTTELQNQKQTVDQLKQQLEATEQQLAQIKPQTRSVLPASISLFPAGLRGSGDIEILTVQPDQDRIRLELNLDNDEYPTYRVSIEPANNRGPNLPPVRAYGPPSQRRISVQFRSNQLNAGDYVVKVNGRTPSGDYEPVTSYRFRLLKK